MSIGKIIAVNVGVIIVLLLALLGGGYYIYEAGNYVTTDDAKIDGTIVPISSQLGSKLLTWSVKEGDHVTAGEVIGTVDTTQYSAQATAQKQSVPSDIGQIKSPIDGTIIQSSAKVGQLVGPAQPLAQVADLSKLDVTANISETNIRDVAVGKDVDVTVDAYPGLTLKGHVDAIGLATLSTFSLIPEDSTSGSYTKVVQRIPVTISLSGYEGKPLMPGMNATVRIAK